ncbi:MAG: sigma factor-like helix-turn-helix DNA-binding protein [Longimicrobiaceae bacterium]
MLNSIWNRIQTATCYHAVHRVSKSALTPQQQEIVLGLLADESPSEIAIRLGISPVTVRTRLMRARAVLRRELHSYLDSPESGEKKDRAG